MVPVCHRKKSSVTFEIDVPCEGAEECFIHDDQCVSESIALASEAVSPSCIMLPAETLEKVFCLLPPRDLKNATLVCKWWREVGEVPHLWTWACLKVDCHLYSAPMLLEMLASRRLHPVRKVKVVRSGFRSNEVAILEALMPAVEDHPGQLEYLDLAYNLNLYELDAHFFGQAVIKLVEVHFSNLSHLNCGQIDSIFTALQYNSGLLKRLAMYYVDLSFVSWTIMARAINQLVEVDLIGANLTCLQITEMFTMMIKHSNLKKLNLSFNFNVLRVNQELLADALAYLEEVKLPTRSNMKHFLRRFGEIPEYFTWDPFTSRYLEPTWLRPTV